MEEIIYIRSWMTIIPLLPLKLARFMDFKIKNMMFSFLIILFKAKR